MKIKILKVLAYILLSIAAIIILVLNYLVLIHQGWHALQMTWSPFNLIDWGIRMILVGPGLVVLYWAKTLEEKAEI